MAEDLRRVAELIDFWKKLDLRTFQRELRSVQPELKCLLQEFPNSVDPRAADPASPCTTCFAVDAGGANTAAVSDPVNTAPFSPSSSSSSSPSTLPLSPAPTPTDTAGFLPCQMPSSLRSDLQTADARADGEPPAKEPLPMAVKGLLKKIRKFFRVQDILSLLINYGDLLRLLEAVLAEEEPFSELQTFLSTSGRRGRRKSTNGGRLKPGDAIKAAANLDSKILRDSPDEVYDDSSAIVVESGDFSISQPKSKHSDQSVSRTSIEKSPIGRYCPLTVPKYVPSLRPGMYSRPNATLSSRSDVPSFDRHHDHHVAISSSSSSSPSSSSFPSVPLSMSWTSFDTSAPTNGHSCEADDSCEDGNDGDNGECMDLRIESKRLSSSSSLAFTTSLTNDVCQFDPQEVVMTGVASDLLPKSRSWDGLSEGEKEVCLKMKTWLENDDVTGHELKNRSNEGAVGIDETCLSSGKDLLEPFQKQQEFQHGFVDRFRDAGGAWEVLTNGHERTSDMMLPLINNNVNRSIKRKRKDKTTGFSSDTFRAKRFLPNHDERPASSKGTGANLNSSMVCDSSNCRKGTTRDDDDEKKKATKELISRIYMKELERLVESAEKRGESVELQTYKDELEKIRKTLMASEEKKVEREDEMNSDFNKNNCGKAAPAGIVSVKSEETINIKAEKEDALDVNFVAGAMSSCYEAPNQPSPLQRIQSIFNSGIMRPTNHSKSPSIKQTSNHHHHGHHSRTALPPIDQHQLEAHLDINTEELVKKVREFLGRFSISQRLFGEKVLGLSQGSVSDLLARPKPWCVLTQKGREPFARMKMFLEDRDGIMTRLLTSQCKVMTSAASTTAPSMSSTDDSKAGLDFPPKGGSSAVLGHHSVASQLLQHGCNITAGATPANHLNYDKLSAAKQPIPSLLNNPIPLKIPLHHTSSPRNSPKPRSPWTTSSATDGLPSAGYLSNFPFSTFLPSVLSMIGNSVQSPLSNPVPPFLSPSPFFPLMVPGYPSMPAHANLLRNLPYGFSSERTGVEVPLNLRDTQDQHQNGCSRSSSRIDSNFHLNSPSHSLRNSQDSKGLPDDNNIDDPEEIIKEESVSDSTEPLEKLSEENRNVTAKQIDSTPSNPSICHDDHLPSLPYVMGTPTVDKAKAISEYSFRDVHQFELDTQAITARVKELLQQSNLGQKLFGEAVLELSQGSVSELLSKPKPWTLLSLKGREPFIKMNAWLADPHGVEKLRNFHLNNGGVPGTGANGYRGLVGGTKSSKRKTTSEADSPSSTSSLIPQLRIGPVMDGEKDRATDEEKKKKRPRLFFTEEQKAKLREAYDLDPYPSQMAIERLARELCVGSKTVVNWFHNHRMRAKQVVASNSTNNISHNNGFGSIKNIIHQHIFSSALSFCQEGKPELLETSKEPVSPSVPDEEKSGDALPEESENSSHNAGISSCSVGISFNKRKRSKPLKVPEVPMSHDTNSFTEPSNEGTSPMNLMEQLRSIPPNEF